MKRQGLTISLKEIEKLFKDLIKEGLKFPDEGIWNRKFQINIINKEGLSDTWEIDTPYCSKKSEVKK